MATEDQPHTTVIRTDEPVSVNIGNGCGYWFRVFNAVIDSGAWAELSPSAKAVLPVLARNVNEQVRQDRGEWLAWPSIRTIQKLAGTQRAATYYAIAELEQAGLLARRAGGGGRHTTMYQLLDPGPVHVRGPVHTRGRVGSTGVDGRGPRTCTQRRSKEEDRPTAEERHKQPPDRTAAATGSAETDPEILDALTAAEIGEPARSRLAGLPGMTAGLVERTVRKCQDRPSGVLIRALEAAAEAAVVRRRRAAERRAREGVGVPPTEEPEPVTGEAREQGLEAMREALGRRMND